MTETEHTGGTSCLENMDRITGEAMALTGEALVTADKVIRLLEENISLLKEEHKLERALAGEKYGRLERLQRAMEALVTALLDAEDPGRLLAMVRSARETGGQLRQAGKDVNAPMASALCRIMYLAATAD